MATGRLIRRKVWDREGASLGREKVHFLTSTPTHTPRLEGVGVMDCWLGAVPK